MSYLCMEAGDCLLLNINGKQATSVNSDLNMIKVSTVRSLILRNRFLQISPKLLNTLLYNFAAWNTHEATTSHCGDICQKPFRKNSERTVDTYVAKTHEEQTPDMFPSITLLLDHLSKICAILFLAKWPRISKVCLNLRHLKMHEMMLHIFDILGHLVKKYHTDFL